MKFNVDDWVTVINALELTGSTGEILGSYAPCAEMSMYIVRLDVPVDGQKAIVITEHCLEKWKPYV